MSKPIYEEQEERITRPDEDTDRLTEAVHESKGARHHGQSPWMEPYALVDDGNKTDDAGCIADPESVENILKESNERYRTIFENSGTATIIADERTVILLANARFEKLSGYSKDELQNGMSWTQFIADEDRDRMRGFNELRMADPGSPPRQYEFRFRDRQGRVRDIFLNVDVIPGKRQIVASCLDITDRKHMENAMRESEKRYRLLAENIRDVIWTMDLNLNYTYISPSCTQLTGFTPDELMRLPLEKWLDEDSYRQAVRVFREELDYEKSVTRADPLRSKTLELKVRCKNESVAWIEVRTSFIRNEKGAPVEILGVARGISERKQAEMEMKKSEERFRGLAELLPQTVYETDERGMLTFVNHGAFEQFRYNRKDFRKGLHIFQMIAEPDRDGVKEAFQKVLTGHKAGLYECVALRKDGTSFQALIHSSAIMRGGIPVGVRGFLIDISEKKDLELQLMHAQKMEAIGTLAGGIAHDFNNLLMGIQGNASLALLGIEASSPCYERLRSIEKYVKSGAELTKQLLGFARGGKYEVRPTDIGHFLVKSSEMFGRTKKEIRIHRSIMEGLWNVEADQGQMEQVLLNLYVNAWQAMPGGGDLSIRAENVGLDKEFVGPYGIRPGRYVKTSITDSGVGMDEATMERIFEPFFTTKEMGRGTGLGLASVYGIIKNHGGAITVESRKGAGSTFTFYLPASARCVKENERPSTPALHHGSETILLVDDEEMILDVGSQMLACMGYWVLKAGSGLEALEVYRENRARIDLVILDMIMPDMGGGETYEGLKRIDPTVKVLLSSGYSLDGNAGDIMEKGCRGFIQKPFDIAVLSEKIREILEGSSKESS